jgi:chorismate mutase/prephenate dehydratase
MKDLAEIRQEIDQIDDQIVALYEERMKLTGQVAEYKIANHKKVFDKEREDLKLSMVLSKVHSPFSRQGVRDLFEQIMSSSRKRQYQMMHEHGVSAELGFECVESLKDAHARVVFQGVEGAYSQQAMMEYFGTSCDSYHVDTWKDAMEAIRKKEADYAVLPIENSSAGIVSENYDLLVEYDNYIVGEQVIKIEHALLGLPDAQKEDIEVVYSHPQALMQCAQYFEEHRNWEKFSLKNTAMAAQKVKEDCRKNQAAIASPVNAEIYGLKVLEHPIQDNQNNSTRFIIVTGRKIYRKNAKGISICFEIPHESGSLYRMLSHFIYNNLNLTNIQSRPLRDRNWEYRFFVDFEGSFADSAVENALLGLKEEAVSLRILGTY